MNFKDELIQMKKELETKYVLFYNDGERDVESSQLINQCGFYNEDPYKNILSEVKYGYERYLRNFYAAEINMGIKLGIMYNSCDVNEDGTLKEGATPIYDKIRFYTLDLDAFDANGKKNEDYYNEFRTRHYGFMNMSDFVKRSFKEGFEYDGPLSFEELAEKINNGEIFDINLTVVLGKKNEPKEEIVEPAKKKFKFFK